MRGDPPLIGAHWRKVLIIGDCGVRGKLTQNAARLRHRTARCRSCRAGATGETRWL